MVIIAPKGGLKGGERERPRIQYHFVIKFVGMETLGLLIELAILIAVVWGDLRAEKHHKEEMEILKEGNNRK